MMKEIFAALVFVCIIVSVACQEYVPGSPARRSQARSGVVTTFDCTGSTPASECGKCTARFGQLCNDCQTALLCFGEPLMKQPCAMLDPSKPYCRDSDGACVAEAPTGCTLPTATDFKCTDKGQFPDPADCTKYYYCKEAGANKASAFNCPPSYVYDSKTGLCKQKKTTTDCKTISCKNHPNQYQIFGADKSILAFCLQSGETSETILFRCSDPISMEYDENSLKCEFICKTEGRFPIQGETSKYFECYRNGKVLESRTQDCPASFDFDKDLKTCK